MVAPVPRETTVDDNFIVDIIHLIRQIFPLYQPQNFLRVLSWIASQNKITVRCLRRLQRKDLRRLLPYRVDCKAGDQRNYAQFYSDLLRLHGILL